jgi:hypothetical protein
MINCEAICNAKQTNAKYENVTEKPWRKNTKKPHKSTQWDKQDTKQYLDTKINNNEKNRKPGRQP